MSERALEFTGERFTPECVREIRYEHFARYAFAHGLARGKRVLDAACGEGYGSAMLATTAASVLGVDIAANAIDHARSRYGGHVNLRFVQGDCTALEVPRANFDLITSFETLEHVEAQAELISGFARALTPAGLLLISSPDKRTYSDVSGFRNEFHVRELYRDELLAVLAPHFPHIRLYGQKLLFQSAIWNLEHTAHTAASSSIAGDEIQPRTGLDYAPLYFVAACSRMPLPAALADLHLFGDREESVYTHYNAELRRLIHADMRIVELEAHIARLEAELATFRARR